MALTVEVVYAPEVTVVELSAGATLGDAILASGVLDRHPEIDWSSQKFGIFGKVAVSATRLKDGDRVEVYRPLAMDPKEARRRRAEAARKSTRAPARRKGNRV